MSDIEFNEEQYNSSANFEEPNSRFAQAMIDWGLAKDGKSANTILIFISLIFFGTSVFFFLKFAGIF